MSPLTAIQASARLLTLLTAFLISAGLILSARLLMVALNSAMEEGGCLLSSTSQAFQYQKFSGERSGDLVGQGCSVLLLMTEACIAISGDNFEHLLKRARRDVQE